jgi:hypothetical protein
MLLTKYRFIWMIGFRGEDILEIDQLEQNCMWRPCVLMDRNEKSKIYRGPGIHASCKVFVYLTERF